MKILLCTIISIITLIYSNSSQANKNTYESVEYECDSMTVTKTKETRNRESGFTEYIEVTTCTVSEDQEVGTREIIKCDYTTKNREGTLICGVYV